MKRPATSEAELAAVVIQWLEALGADVFQEVECSGGVADIVARVGAELWIIETKVSWSLALLFQAMERRRDAHRVFIAAPYARGLRDAAHVCRELGIGVLVVHLGSQGCDAGSGYDLPNVREEVPGQRWNRRPVALAARLQPEHKTHARAGTNGGRWTPFRRTCEQLACVVRETPGIALKAAIDAVKHHYSTGAAARSHMASWIVAGKVAGVRLEPGAPPTLHPTGAP